MSTVSIYKPLLEKEFNKKIDALSLGKYSSVLDIKHKFTTKQLLLTFLMAMLMVPLWCFPIIFFEMTNFLLIVISIVLSSVAISSIIVWLECHYNKKFEKEIDGYMSSYTMMTPEISNIITTLTESDVNIHTDKFNNPNFLMRDLYDFINEL